MAAQRAVADTPRLEANLWFVISAGIIGLCFAVAALALAVPIWLGVLGLGMAVFATASVQTQVRYGSGKLTDTGRVIRSWLRL